MKADLSDFFSAVEDIKFKNCGGCLYFCYVFYKWLKQNDMDTSDFQIIQYSKYSDEVEANLEWINYEEGASSAYHFTWVYDGIEMDAEGELSYEPDVEHRVELGGLNTPYCDVVEAFCEDALINGSWNFMFDRNEAIKIVKKTLGINTKTVAL